MEKDARIYLAGHQGLVGSNILKALQDAGYTNVITRDLHDLDLTDAKATDAHFEETRPEYVILAAALVGGIHANNTYPGDFIRVNLQIETNVIDAARRFGVKRLLFLGSSCIYPKFAPQPMKEEHLLTGILEPTNEPYAIAKISGVIMVRAYRRQYGMESVALMPTNLYGPGDNFHPQNSHVLPALIRRFHEAKEENRDEVVVWGTGTPRREFLFVEDLADAVVFLMNQPTEKIDEHTEDMLINVGVGEDISIRELAELVKKVVGYEGKLTFDTSKPDGTPRKLLDVSRLHAMGWKSKTSLEEGIRATYNWVLEHGFDRAV